MLTRRQTQNYDTNNNYNINDNDNISDTTLSDNISDNISDNSDTSDDINDIINDDTSQPKSLTLEEIHNLQDAVFENNKDCYLLNKSYDVVDYIICISYKSVKFIFKISGVYLLWIFLHYFSAHLYVKFCTPKTIWGYLISPFLASSPHCNGLRWIINNGSNIINNMWLLLGTWLGSYFLILNPNK